VMHRSQAFAIPYIAPLLVGFTVRTTYIIYGGIHRKGALARPVTLSPRSNHDTDIFRR
jgi:hypothetical protein